MEIVLARKLLEANDELARRNRERLRDACIFVLNMLGSPGAGKTTLLEALLPRWRGELGLAVIEGDLATSRDAERIEKVGVPSVQINTGGGCHLDAGMVAEALDALDLAKTDLIVIENVGNLVCTAGFDLGENARLVVLSVTEGDDKVEKYPSMFRRANAVAANKIDLLAHTNFSVDRMREDLARIAPECPVLPVSATTGEGIEACARWVLDRFDGWRAEASR